MPAIDDNGDTFVVHPTYAMAALLPDRQHVDRLIDALSAGIDVGTVVEVMHGEDGLRILDQRGARHGQLAWLHRLVQSWTYYEEILGLYNEGLSSGQFLTVVPCGPDDRHRVATATAAQGGRLLYYFGFESVESLG
jgi:hypothetical protein